MEVIQIQWVAITIMDSNFYMSQKHKQILSLEKQYFQSLLGTERAIETMPGGVEFSLSHL